MTNLTTTIQEVQKTNQKFEEFKDGKRKIGENIGNIIIFKCDNFLCFIIKLLKLTPYLFFSLQRSNWLNCIKP